VKNHRGLPNRAKYMALVKWARPIEAATVPTNGETVGPNQYDFGSPSAFSAM
jgi:hypothetical protein